MTPIRPIIIQLNGNINDHSTFRLKGRIIPLNTIDKRNNEATYILVIVVLTTGLVYKWNLIFAHFNVNSVFYIPHITKIYVSSLLLLSVIFRGIIRPLRRNVEWSFIFPFKWVLIGLLGVALDIVKAPGYIWGGMLAFMGKTINKTT